MVVNLSREHSLIGNWIAEIRDVEVQKDRMRFRRNLERIGEVAAYEISKKLPMVQADVQTPLGTAPCNVLAEQPVLATILRAGLPLHQGLLNYFDKADAAYISAYRKHNKTDGTFEISLEYLSSPTWTAGSWSSPDPMLATGASLVKAVQYIRAEGEPSQIHIVTAIACSVGIELVRREVPTATLWCAAIDEELTAKAILFRAWRCRRPGLWIKNPVLSSFFMSFAAFFVI